MGDKKHFRVVSLKGLTTKILAPVLLITIAGFIAIAIQGYFAANQIIASNLEQSSGNKVQKLVTFIEGKLEKWSTQIEDLSYCDAAKTMDLDALRQYTDTRRSILGDFELFFIADTEGNTVCTEGPRANLKETSYFKTALSGKLIVSDPVLFGTILKPVIVIAAPVKDSTGRIIGVIGGTISIKLISDTINTENFGQTGYVFMLTRSGLFIAYPSQNTSPLAALSVLEENAFRSESPSLAAVLEKMKQGKSGADAYSIGTTEKKVFYAPVKSTGWTVAASIRSSEVFETLRKFQKKSVVTTASSLMLIMLFLTSVLTLMIIRPIRKLSNGVSEYASGNLGWRPEINSDDELGHLAKDFSKMASQLQGMIIERDNSNAELYRINTELESIVQQRTSELTTANEQLLSINGVLNDTNTALQEEIEFRTNIEAEMEMSNRELSKTMDELKETQKQMVLQEKMAVLGSMVAGVAHEMNTPVGICITMSSYLEKEISTAAACLSEGRLSLNDLGKVFSTSKEALHLISTNLQRTVSVVSSFKNVAVNQTTDAKKRFSIRSYTEDILSTLKPKWKQTDHKVTLSCPDDLEICSYPGAYSQIFSHLITNSLQHAFRDIESGVMSIEIEPFTGGILLTYMDNGSGFTSEALRNVFTPFFTTNRSGGGTGLGLHIVYNLVTQRIGGTIDCESSPGKGACFRIVIPDSGPCDTD